ncbi:hypothetical protein RMR16_020135 [Agrobacterium sp. rho-13.3]|uniref:hypothetical protein n=1 Tax=Agrobacterium sp. rho-13.3 TaxID=3072980 RepID=UPI002A135195|nr:hypothetical protein [Agrobacterium sp. rho-13.3]MDX8306214.1 hypothetical protein [Agrobacterium sp. rho-13.3]MDX8307455.1 hypothetical protein [Agrobacterium sp. rho-13.3]
MKRLFIALSAVCSLGVLVFVWLQSDSDRFRNNVPCGIEVESTGFAASDYTGIGGPGDFFVIFAVFDIAESTAEHVNNSGVSFLQNLHCQKSTLHHQGRPKKYFSWKTSPSLLQTQNTKEKFASISEYLSKRNMYLDIPPEILIAAQNALSTSGNFIGEQNNGFFILDSGNKKAYYLFSN